MTILVPMAGAGRRFSEAGYSKSKPAILTTSLKLHKKVPMVVAATLDIPHAKDSNIIFVDRDYHKQDGLQEEIKEYLPQAKFITIDYLTEGQAATCLLTKDFINNNQELFVGSCDNGMFMDISNFEQTKNNADAIIITHSNDSNIEKNPNAHSWVYLDGNNTVTKMSIKTLISTTPMLDHATTGMFWFKKGTDFINALEEMISKKDITGGEYYVDQAIQYLLNKNLKVKIFDITYLCWGTAADYEIYEKTVNYWQTFLQNEEWLQ